MKTVKKLILIIISLFLLCYIYNNFFLKRMLVGDYVNKNYNYRPFTAEIPYEQDTLRLFDDNRFTSHFWKKGTYRILYNLGGTEIELTYEDEYGKAGFVGSINRLFFGKPKILLDRDRNHYLEKE